MVFFLFLVSQPPHGGLRGRCCATAAAAALRAAVQQPRRPARRAAPADTAAVDDSALEALDVCNREQNSVVTHKRTFGSITNWTPLPV
jgi:hypothetical protein